MEKHLAIIAARSGSKSIKNKNLLTLNHKTLVRLAIEPALKSNVFSRIIISTDYPRHHLGIEDLPQSMTQVIYSGRSRELSEDNTPIMDVIKSELVNWGGDEKWVWLLQPTSPFRVVDDFLKIKTALSSGEWESSISFKPVKEFIDRIYTVKEGTVYRINQGNYKNKQEIKPQVTRSGNFYVTKRLNILEKESFEVKPFFPYIMGNIDVENCSLEEKLRSRKLGINIDDAEDFEFAKGVIRRGDFII
jgi:CMP-N-acetylneuraminic acid synthetase